MFRIFYYSHIVLIYLFSASVTAIDIEKGITSSFDIKAYLEEQVPEGIYSEYACPEKGSYSFDNKEICRVSCLIVGEAIFNIKNVKMAYFSQSASRVALVIDLFKAGEETDTIASFSSEVSCIFSGLVLEYRGVTPQAVVISTEAPFKETGKTARDGMSLPQD